MKEDNKGQNLINIANKYKRPQLIEQFISLGVPCPPDIKRKLAQQKTLSTTRSKKRENQTGNDQNSDSNNQNGEGGADGADDKSEGTVVVAQKPKYMDPVLKSNAVAN